MSRLSDRFVQLKDKGEKALVLFVTAGDPDLADLPAIARFLQDAGADVLEVGIPFSDPIADGPVIQASTQRALDRGVRTRDVLERIAKVELEIPVVAMGYWNPILRMGPLTFAEAAIRGGVDGVILSDLIPEEAADWISVARSHDLDTIFLATPTSDDARLDRVCEVTRGFVYAVARLGVTGAGEGDTRGASTLVANVKKRTHLPVCLGFGLSTPEDVRGACGVADGAIVGSWLVSRLATDWATELGRNQLFEDIRALKAATRS